MSEDYVGFETAKLLKEKGFDELTPLSYRLLDGFPQRITCRNSFDTDLVSRITLQMAMKWLREIHNKSIEIRSQGLKIINIGWVAEIYNLMNQKEEFNNPYAFITYEEAAEAAIKYCLENLI